VQGVKSEQIASEASVCRFGDYDLHDLIELDQQTVGVMVQADAETCQILTNRNAVSTLFWMHFVPDYSMESLHGVSCAIQSVL